MSLPGSTAGSSLKDRLLVEFGKELSKNNAKADKAKQAGAPFSLKWSFALQAAVNSLSSSHKDIHGIEDLEGMKGFGDHILSLARTCLARIRTADPGLSPRPLRPRVKALVPRQFAPRAFSQTDGILEILRRHDVCTLPEIRKINALYGYSATPFVEGAKGFTGAPFAHLVERGLLIGSRESGWSLTAEGEEVADRCLVRFDKHVAAGKGNAELDDEWEAEPEDVDGKAEKKETQRTSKRKPEAEPELQPGKAKKPKQSVTSSLSDSFWEDDDLEILSVVPAPAGSARKTPSSAGSGSGSAAHAGPAAAASVDSSSNAQPSAAAAVPGTSATIPSTAAA